jgi:hypothetical protein
MTVDTTLCAIFFTCLGALLAYMAMIPPTKDEPMSGRGYLSISSPTLQLAFHVACEINARIEARADAIDPRRANEWVMAMEEMEKFRAHVSVAEESIAVLMGEEVVWDDDNDSIDDLTAAFCLAALERAVAPLNAFLDSRRGPSVSLTILPPEEAGAAGAVDSGDPNQEPDDGTEKARTDGGRLPLPEPGDRPERGC